MTTVTDGGDPGTQVSQGSGSSTAADAGRQQPEVDVTSLPEYQAAMLLWEAWPPILLVLGGFGNVATILVMRRIRDGHSSQYAILMALALCDLALLLVGAPREWASVLFGTDVRLWHPALCKLHVWVVYSTGTTSAWLVTSVTVQRTMAVLWPLRMRALCTLRRTWVVVASVVLAAFLVHSHLLVGMEISGGGRCDGAPGSAYQRFFHHVYFLLDTCMSSLFPALCLLVCDVILSVTLFKAAASSSLTAAVEGAGSGGVGDQRRKTASRTTVMVLVVSCAFLVLTLPVCACLLYLVYSPLAEDPRSAAREELMYAVTFFLWYANSAVNFLLYCLTGARFRKEFWDWVRCYRRPLSASAAAFSGGRGETVAGSGAKRME